MYCISSKIIGFLSHHRASGRTGGYGFHIFAFSRGSGVLPRILLTLTSNTGVHFSTISKALRVSYNWAAVLAPTSAQLKYWYLMAQARARWVSLQPSSFLAISESSFRLRRFFSVELESQQSSFIISRGKGLCLSLNLLTWSSVICSKYFPVRKPPASGLQPTSPYLKFLKMLRFQTSFSARYSILYQFQAPIGLWRFSLQQISMASMTASASQLEVAQQKAFPAQMTSWKPRHISYRGVRSSKKCAQIISTQSIWSLFREPFKLSFICLRLMMLSELISGSGATRILVAITTYSLGTPKFLRILPNCISALPAAYFQAVSKWLIPWARAVLMICSSTSQFSSRKLIILPRAITEVWRPELPKYLQTIFPGFREFIFYQICLIEFY